MKSRTATLIVTLILVLLAAPLVAEAQPPAKVIHIAYLTFPCIRPGWYDFFLPLEVVRQALHQLGYLGGHNVTTAARCANRTDVLNDVAADLTTLSVDVIVASGTEAIQAAKRATKEIPIVMVSDVDPVETGLVPSLARPGGNLTGVSLMTSDLGAKRLELLKEVIPRISRVAVLWNPTDPAAAREWGHTQAAARVLGVTLEPLQVRSPDDFDSAFLVMTNLRTRALVTVLDSLTFASRIQIVAFAAKSRLPSMYGLRVFVEAGGLMAYQPSITESARLVAAYVDKILKGAKPADLPIEEPTKFELVINLKTAKALGLTIPPAVLLRADEVIQ